MKLDRICISTWSFHEEFEAGRMQVLDFPEMIADRFQVHNLEIVAPHFGATARSYFHEVRERLDRAGSRIVNIPIDIKELWETPSLSSPDPAVRDRAIALYSEWIERAQYVDAHSVRCDPGLINLEDLSPTIDSYKKLVAYGAERGTDVAVENHGSAAAYPEQLAEILRAAGASALPDFGNFPDDDTRERGLRLLFPLAKAICHAKLIPDIGRCVEIAEAAGFKGSYSIESADVRGTIDALLGSA